jgi:lipopolysaccharide transport system ATP-binding protein
MSKVIEIKNLSKIYDLGLVGTGSLSKDLNRSWAKLRGKPDPYATLVELNDRTQKSSSNMVYALKDINFSVDQGEVLGIIGKNGAGKSTLLKILSQITSPSTGTIKMRGRVASLLEVGTGMHPEMTARQNIYLNGSLMGMRRHEITSKLDEILDFSGVEKYIDTPVKRFSSGMSVRLGFAVAAFLEPEILIVDEVLAVGDYEFQKKAIGKMQDVSKGLGRTVLFVSHNMASIKKLCNKGIVLSKGQIIYQGGVTESINHYLNNNKRTGSKKEWKFENAPGNKKIKILNFSVLGENNDTNIFIDSLIKIRYAIYSNIEKSTLGTTIRILNHDEQVVFSDGTLISKNSNSKKKIYQIETTIPSKFLNSGLYTINVVVGENKRYVLFNMDNIVSFQVKYGGDIKHSVRQKGIIYSELDWLVK